jgi:hypothetical protein
MFKGKAGLIDPEKGGTIATFTEICDTEGSATAKVVLKHPVELEGTERLEVYGTVKDTPVISISAKHPAGVVTGRLRSGRMGVCALDWRALDLGVRLVRTVPKACA